MNISEVLADYKSDNPIKDVLLGMVVKEQLKKDPKYVQISTFFDKVCPRGDGWDVREMGRICKKLGLVTMDDLQEFSDSLTTLKFSILYDIIKPLLKIDITGFKKATANELLLILMDRFPDAVLNFGDAEYVILPENHLQDLLNEAPTNRFSAIGEGRDCEDYSRIFRGWLSESGVGNLAFGYFEFEYVGGDSNIHAHAAIVGIVSNTKNVVELVFIEPRTKTIIANPDSWFPDMSSMGVRWVWF